MTAKEKAVELYSKLYEFVANPTIEENINKANVKECVIICCEEIIKEVPYLEKKPWILNTETVEFWEEVKQEIEKL